jgi:RNA polymerase sigma factor (sigma-70 family)
MNINLNLDQLLTAARSGDKTAEKDLFSKLYVRFRAIAYRILRDSHATEDVVQEAVMDVLRTYKELEVKESFAAWARTVVRNRALKYLESKKRQTDLLRNLSQKAVISSSSSSDPDLNRRLIECLKKLNEDDNRYSKIINMKHQGYRFDEISDKMAIKANHAYVILHRARKALKDCLDNRRIS